MSIFLNLGFQFKFGGRKRGFIQLRFQTFALVLEQWCIGYLKEERNRVLHLHGAPEKLNGRIIFDTLPGKGTSLKH